MTTSQRLLRTLALTATALGTLTLTACGTQGAAGRPAATAAPAAVTASPSPRMLSGKDLERHSDPTVRAQAIALRIADTCSPGSAIELPPLPDVSLVAETVGPPVRTPSEEPVPLPPDLPEPPGPEATVSYDEVPLDEVDRCAADAHADRVRAAFATGAPADEAALRKALAGADFLPESVHRMPGDGALRARIDLRDLSPNDNLALEVTATATGVRVDAFGAPIAGDPDITGIRRGRTS
ncbi:hypothetical protein [Streptomyces roseolus]|uniref:hypothetical protein n=1 Tax=Streptomyces roseolus TaxID=67358 RepID=UPI001679097F|nr:hypothetical protein [Streptomyces roseolus]